MALPKNGKIAVVLNFQFVKVGFEQTGVDFVCRACQLPGNFY